MMAHIIIMKRGLAMKNKLKQECWPFLRNISLITLIATFIILCLIISYKEASFIIIIFWPLIIIIAALFIISIISLIISLFKLKKLKEVI